MFIGKEKCVTEKQPSPGTNCFPWAFVLKFLAMINENILGYDLLLAVSNSLSPSVALFFISLASWSRGSITSFLAPSCINVLCWTTFPDPHPRHVHCLLQIPPWYTSRQARGRWITGYFFNIYKKSILGVLCRVVLHLCLNFLLSGPGEEVLSHRFRLKRKAWNKKWAETPSSSF